MRFQISQGWLVGQTLIPASVIIDLTKPDHALTEFDRLAKGRVPPIDIVSLDYDCALTMWCRYPEFRHRLRRHLSPFDEETFQELAVDETKLRRWGP